jgi:hypothetical protein
MIWLILGGFALVLLLGAVAQFSVRRHPRSGRFSEPDDFLNDDHPFAPSSSFYEGKISRLR